MRCVPSVARRAKAGRFVMKPYELNAQKLRDIRDSFRPAAGGIAGEI